MMRIHTTDLPISHLFIAWLPSQVEKRARRMAASAHDKSLSALPFLQLAQPVPRAPYANAPEPVVATGSLLVTIQCTGFHTASQRFVCCHSKGAETPISGRKCCASLVPHYLPLTSTLTGSISTNGLTPRTGVSVSCLDHPAVQK